FTLASYLIEGRPSRDFAKVKAFMYSEPAAFDKLLTKLSATMTGYLRAQVDAGASALQLFDSWVGALAVEDYDTRVLPHTRSIFDALKALGVPRIHFGTDTASLLESIATAGPDIVSLDWRIPLDTGWARVGLDRGIQGNLDPAVLLGPSGLVRERVRDVLRRAGGRPGHIFNLGHGVLPSTPLENLQLLVETVHEWQVASVG
ncbi:MAG TPA: uroporphyrinogen decarboxylase family protein, partial [Clostridia bacterium]|nr:uroporphyrinogen decarboxylase family protein [Clostridia bacterium]